MARCRAGESRAWEALVERFAPLIFSVPRRYGFSREDCEDIFQRTVIEIYRGLERAREITHLGAWVLTIATRISWRHKREQEKRAQWLSRNGSELHPADRPDPADVQERNEQIERVRRAVARLSGAQRRLIEALYLEPEDPSYPAGAERLSIPRGSIGPTRRRSLERLRKLLREGGDGPGRPDEFPKRGRSS